MVFAGAMVARVSLRSGSYTRWAPTAVLVLLERPGPSLDHRSERELFDRLERGEVRGWARDRLIRAARDELEAPTLLWNGADDYPARRRARGILSITWPDSREAFESLLDSPRWEAACIACDTLWDERPDRPSDALLRATVNQLSDDHSEPGRYYRGGNARRAVARLLPHLERVLPQLEAALDSQDPQQRLLAALIIASEHAGSRQHDAHAILVDGLRSNDTRGDAMAAASGLVLAGRAAGDALDRGRRSNDPQQAAWCAAIADLHAGLTWDRIEPRLEPFRLTVRSLRPMEHDTLSAASLLGY